MIRARVKARSSTFFRYVGRQGDDGESRARQRAFPFELPDPSGRFKAVHDRHLRSVREGTKADEFRIQYRLHPHSEHLPNVIAQDTDLTIHQDQPILLPIL